MPSVDEVELLAKLAAGELSAEETARVRAQVASSPELQRIQARLERLDVLAAIQGAEDRAAAVSARDEAAIEAALRARGRPALRVLVAAAAAAAVLAVLAGGAFFLGRPQAHPVPGGAERAANAPSQEVPEAVALAEEELPPYPPDVPGIIVGPLAEGLALWTPESKLGRDAPDTVLLEEGTLVLSGRGRVQARGYSVEIDGEVLVSTEPEKALAHVIRSLRSHPQPEGSHMRKRFEGFRGLARAPAGAVLWVLVSSGHAVAGAPDGTTSRMAKGESWSSPAVTGTTGSQKRPGPASVTEGEVALAGVHTAVLSASQALAGCFAEGQQRNPKLEGELTLVLGLVQDGGRGRLREATVADDYSLANPLVANCVLGVLQTAPWPKPESASATVRYPLGFAARGSSGTPGADVWLPEGAQREGPRLIHSKDREGRIDVGGSGHTLGPDTAAVKVVVFSDFECSFCIKGYRVLSELRGRYGDRIQLEFRHKPLPTHPNARLSAAAAIAAARQGKFWEFAHRLVDEPGRRGVEAMEAHATALGLDLLRFRRDLEDPATRALIDADIAEAERIGARGIPTTYVNGRELVGVRAVEAYVRLIDEELATAPRR